MDGGQLRILPPLLTDEPAHEDQKSAADEDRRLDDGTGD